MIVPTHFSIDKDLISKAMADGSMDEEVTVLNQKTGDFFYEPWEILPKYQNTIWQTILNSLPEDKGEARIIMLKPGESYICHADIDDRWHLNLSGNFSYLIDITNERLYPTVLDGVWYDMNTSLIHTASNFGSINRYQLVIRKLLKSSTKTDLVSVTLFPSKDQYDYRFKFDQRISPWLNINSKKGNISKFRFDNQIVQFNMSQSVKDDFEKILSNDFTVTYA